MARLVIENFNDFLESYNTLLEEGKGSIVTDALALISATTSESTIKKKGELVKKLGIKTDTSYTFTTSLLELLYYLGANKKFKPELLKSSEPVKKGTDILTIGDKTISQKGDMYIGSKDVSKPVKITASNNGLLCLARAGRAIWLLMSNYNVNLKSGVKDYGNREDTIHECKDWLMKLTLGGPVSADTSRGYAYYSIYPGSLTEYAGFHAVIISLGILQFSADDFKTKVKMAISKNNKSNFDRYVDNWYKNYIDKSKSIGECLQKAVEQTSKDLSQSGDLVNTSPKLNTESADALVSKNNYYTYFSSGNPLTLYRTSGISMVALKPEGEKAFKKVLEAMADSLVPSSFDDWGSEADTLVNQYKEAMKRGLSQCRINEWLETVQRVNNWGSTTPSLGAIVKVKKKQGEGEID